MRGQRQACNRLTNRERVWYSIRMIRCILFDRDGTLGELSDKRFPQTFTPYADIPQTVEKLKNRGLLVGIITNQASIARGTANGYDFEREFSFYGVDDWAICPHDSHDNCDCRKPKSGLLFQLCAALSVYPDECLVVGDRLSDILCAKNGGAQAALVSTGYGEREKEDVLRLFPDTPILSRFDEVFQLL